MHKEFHSHISEKELNQLVDLINSQSAKRILILGRTGVGKSHFARRLAKALSYKHIESDKYYWKSQKGAAINENFLEEIKTELVSEEYIIEGLWKEVRNLRSIRDFDLVIHLKLPLITHLRQLIIRDIKEFILLRRRTSDTWYFLKNYKA